jgi:hypothetical protein
MPRSAAQSNGVVHPEALEEPAPDRPTRGVGWSHRSRTASVMVACASRAPRTRASRASSANSRRMKSFAPVRSPLHRRRAARISLGIKYLGSTIRRRLRTGDVTLMPVLLAVCLRLPRMAARFLSAPQRALGSSSRSSWRAQFRISMSVSAHVRRMRMAAPPVRWEKTRPRSRSRHRAHTLWRWCPREAEERSPSPMKQRVGTSGSGTLLEKGRTPSQP